MGERELPESAEISLDAGLVGDRWLATAHRDEAGAVSRENQLTLMSVRVLELIAAAGARSRSMAAGEFAAHPLVNSIDLGRQLVDGYIAVHPELQSLLTEP